MAARTVKLALALLAGASLAACASPRYAVQQAPGGGKAKPPSAQGGRYKVGQPYQIGGVWYVPREQPDYDQVGIASWYGDAFHLKATANGEVFDMNAVSAAHTTLPLPSIVEVTNLANGRRIQVRVNDRGPFHDNRIIDLSRAAAQELGFERQGVTKVRVRYVGPAPLGGPDVGMRMAKADPPKPRVAPPAPVPAAVTARPLEVAAARVAPPAPVSAKPLAPLIGDELIGPPIEGSGPVKIAASTAAPASSPLRIQVGAYSTEVGAERAATALLSAGRAVIEPVRREGSTLYRVMLPAPADEAEAYALRDRVAAFGFSVARVVGGF